MEKRAAGAIRRLPFLLRQNFHLRRGAVHISARLSEFTGTAVECGETATVPPAAYFFWLVRKSMQKETLDANRIVPQATE